MAKFNLNAYKERREFLFNKAKSGEELTEIEKKAYKRYRGIERRRNIRWQNGKIMLVLGLGLIIFGAIAAASYKVSFSLAVISLIISLMITITSYKSIKSRQYFTFKYSSQLWYLNIFLGMSLIGGMGSIYNSNDSYSIYKNIAIIIYIFIILYMFVTSYIIYSATHKNKDVIDND